MKYYSEFTTKYVQDICDALNKEEIYMKFSDHEPFSPDKIENLTELLHDYVVYNSKIYQLLDMKGLVNRGRCPYTGQTINNTSTNYSYFGRTVFASRKGLEIMQHEADKNLRDVMGDDYRPKPPNGSGNDKGCLVLMTSILLSILLYILI